MIIVRVGQSRIGLLIDQVTGVETYHPSDVRPFAIGTAQDPSFYAGTIGTPAGENLLLLSSAGLRNHPALLAIANGYANIFQSPAQSRGSRSDFRRGHYLLFKLSMSLALPMTELREIIELPSELSRPPGLPDHVLGLHYLRGEVITCLDTRRIYSLPSPTAFSASPTPASPKVLIQVQNGFKFGIVVDRIDSIVAVDEETKISMPRTLLGSPAPGFDCDIREFIEVAEYGNRERHFLIVMEFARLINRLQTPGIAA